MKLLARLLVVVLVGVSVGLLVSPPARADLTDCRSAGYECTPGYTGGNVRTQAPWAWARYGGVHSQTPTGHHNCTLYVAWRLAQDGMGDPGRWGNAWEWAAAIGRGDRTPTVGSVAWWDRRSTEDLGHVAYVEAVEGDRVFIRSDAWVASGGYTEAKWVSVASVELFLHPWKAVPAPVVSGVSFHDNGPQVSFTQPSVPAGAVIEAYEYEERQVGGTGARSGYLGDGLGGYRTRSPGFAEDTGCHPGVVCNYRIRVLAAYRDRYGTSPWSAWRATTGIAAPKITAVSFHDTGPQISFTPPGNVPAGATVQAYEYEEREVGTTQVLDDSYLGDGRGGDRTRSPGWTMASRCQPDMVCQYRIRAVVNGGASAWSSWRALTGISAPRVTAVTHHDYALRLTFEPPADVPSGASVLAYQYEEREVGTTRVLESSYLTDTRGYDQVRSPGYAWGTRCGLEQVCQYRIRAIVNGGASAWSGWRATTPVAAPTLLGSSWARPSDNGPMLEFSPPALPVGATVQVYEFQERQLGSTTVLGSGTLTDRRGTESTRSPALAWGSRCDPTMACLYRIRAILSTGASAWSSAW